nr:MAG TPA: hypothetical protein [Bacteriophage sp.]
MGFFFGTIRAHPFFKINTSLALTGGLLFCNMRTAYLNPFQV